eukprot:COSAG01_NODE_154_length_23851_cov_159.173999_16_plen_119_part_00
MGISAASIAASISSRLTSRPLPLPFIRRNDFSSWRTCQALPRPVAVHNQYFWGKNRHDIGESQSKNALSPDLRHPLALRPILKLTALARAIAQPLSAHDRRAAADHVRLEPVQAFPSS